MLKEYDIAIIFWEDHFHATTSKLPVDIDESITPTLSVGLIIEETEKALILAHDVERYDERDDLTYTLILKSAIVGKKVYGSISIEQPRR